MRKRKAFIVQELDEYQRLARRYQDAVWTLQDIVALGRTPGCELARHRLAQLGESDMDDEVVQTDPVFTHVGWMGFCPIKLACVLSEAPIVAPRWDWLSPLFWVATKVQELVIYVCSLVMEDYTPAWYFKVTGELRGRR